MVNGRLGREHKLADRAVEVSPWKDYRKVTGRLTWRLAVPNDLPRIRRLKNITERFLQQKQRNPNLFSVPVLLTLVAENSRGRVVDLLYVEAQVEIVKMACTEAGFTESIGLEDDLRSWLRSLGFRTALVTTNPRLKDRMAGGLISAGFRCVDELLSYWVQRI